MSNNDWPVGPIIRVRRATAFGGFHIRDAYAIRDAGGDYLVDGEALLRDAGDRIYEWEEVTAVPTAALKHLRDVFLGVELPLTQFAAIQQVVSHLPADTPSALDQAVTRVKETKTVAPRLADFDPEGRLALLLGDLATLQAATHQVPPLISIVRVCTEWVDLIAPGGDALSEVKARAESDPEWGGFTIMASFAGDVAVGIDEGMSDGPMNDLLAIAQYALAWAAQIIEEEDRGDD